MRQLIIMHGVSGSGKSTQVLKEIRTMSNKVCSADYYFQNGDNYNFDVKKLQTAHAWCQAHAAIAASQGVEQILIDNTNMKRADWLFYEELAGEYGYTVRHVWMHGEELDEETLEHYASRNKHGVTREIIEYQLSKMER